MKKGLILSITLLFFSVFSCSTEDSTLEMTKIYSMDDVAVVGIKMKGDFKTDFPQSSDAKWGFLKGREVAIIRYPTIELAKTLGKTAGDEQTELLEVIEKNIAHGPKVEKTECRGHRANKPNSSDVYKLAFRDKLNLENTLILNKSFLQLSKSIN